MVQKLLHADRGVRVEPLSAQIAEALREDILFGRRRQGEALTQQGIAAEYGVSTMPVREALLTLVHEGMVTSRANHTFRVARMERSDVEDIYWMHGILAGSLAERAALRSTPLLISTLEELHDQLCAALKEHDLDAVERLNWSFHREVNRAADAPRILAALRAVVAQIPNHLYANLEGTDEASLHDHPELIDALRKRHHLRARELWTDHVRQGGIMIIDYLSRSGYWEAPPLT